MQTSAQRPKPHPEWLQKLVRLKGDLLHLVYPESCLSCNCELTSGTQHLCHLCEMDLRYTYFENFTEPTPLDKLFWGRVSLASTCALLNFEQDSGTQKILHAIKYKGKKELAEEMGERFGRKLLTNPAKYDSIDALIPIPLHPKKRFIRGYNQSELIADGLSKSMKIPAITDFLTKGTHTKSQTTKNRFMRWDNVSDVFHISPEKYTHLKHIALVDDVVTTGSTLEACIKIIAEALPELKISVLSLAVTK